MDPDRDAAPGDLRLDNALYVTLRAPLSLQPTSDAASQPSLFSKIRNWHLSHSTRARWVSARNVQMRLQSPATSNAGEPVSRPEIEWSWQASGSDQVQRSPVAGHAHQATWDMLGAGKEGNLASWMIETAWGIEDSSGETRADWRAVWAVLFWPEETGSEAGIDIISHRDCALKDETIAQVKTALRSMNDEGLSRLAVEIVEIKRKA